MPHLCLAVRKFTLIRVTSCQRLEDDLGTTDNSCLPSVFYRFMLGLDFDTNDMRVNSLQSSLTTIFIANMKFFISIYLETFCQAMAFICFQYGGWWPSSFTPKVYINAINESFVCPGIKEWNIYSNNTVYGAR